MSAAIGLQQSAGSSPLTRGKPATYQVTAKLGGLIPAHAGKTCHSISSSGRVTAHPRSRGENDFLRPVFRAHPGSSPLTRGKRRLDLSSAARDGLIPAHAGKTLNRLKMALYDVAHPRSRGENVIWKSASSTSQGSSPLTRGKLGYRAPRVARDGLIPAHAGKTWSG